MTVCYHGCVVCLMRMYAFLIFVFNFCLPAYLLAQTDKGSWTIGGFVSYRTQRNPEVQKAFYVAPEVGYFPIKNLVLGIKPGLDITNANPGTVDERRARFYLLQFFSQYYIGSSSTIKPFIGASYGLFNSKYYADSTQFFDTDGRIFEGAIGVIFFINKSIGIENAIGYRALNYEANNDVSKNLSFNVGIKFFL